MFSVDSEFVNHVVLSVRDPEETFTVEIDAVRFFEQAITPGFLEFPLAVENKYRRIRCAEQVDRPFAVDSYRSRQVPHILSRRRRAK